MPDLSNRIQALQLNIEDLLKLLGSGKVHGTLWETLKGLTTPAEFRLLARHIDASTNLVKQLRANVDTVQASAKLINKTATAKAARAGR